MVAVVVVGGTGSSGAADTFATTTAADSVAIDGIAFLITITATTTVVV